MGKGRVIPREAFKQHEKLAKALHSRLLELVAPLPKRVAVLLSSGVDSHAVLFACLEAKKQVATYTFGVRGVSSKDVRVAARTADELKLPWTFIELNPSVEELRSYLRLLYSDSVGAKIHINKSSVECLWPMLRTLPHVDEKCVVVGMGGDVPYATTRSTKKQALHSFEEHLKARQEYARTASRRKDPQSVCTDNWIAANRRGMRVVQPLADPRFLELHRSMHPIHEGWNPIQKAPLRLAFYDWFARCPALIHQSYNAGDTGISDAFEKLLTQSFEGKKFKSVRGLYSAIERGEVKP